MLVSAIAIKLYDGGPVLYKQVRLTTNGRRFYVYKFRSMIVDAEKNGVPQLCTDEDSRITPVGRFLRKCRLDELPQLFNILKGDMSIVGPRPLLVSYLPWYTEEEHHRHDVRPGLTGLAQVNGRNAIKLWESVFAYDLKYVSNITWIGDLKIILSTISKVFKRSDVVVPTGEGGSGRLDVERRNRQNNVTTR